MCDSPPHETPESLVTLLCLEAGKIMEDESVNCAVVLPSSRSEVEEHLAQLAQAGADIAALLAAAQVLHRRCR